MSNEVTCPDCNGSGRQPAWQKTGVACLICHGKKVVPEDHWMVRYRESQRGRMGQMATERLERVE